MSYKKILVISVHPDDETIGCGGTLFKHKEYGDELNWLIITMPKEEYGYSKNQVEAEEQQMKKVAEKYDFKKVFSLGFKPAGINYDIFSDLISAISDVMNELMPEVVYMINRSDIHTDHQIAARAILSCTKSFRYPFIKKVLMYECLSETEIAPQFQENMFIPNVFCDITKYIDDKIDTLNIFQTELQKVPLPRNEESVRALARYRGCSACVKYAEAFMLVRDIM